MTCAGFDTAVLSNAGGRTENQDAADFVVLDGLACWVLADGLGGHGGGGEAARLAVETILKAFRAQPAYNAGILAQSLEAANAAVCYGQQRDPRYSEMRTTAVVLITDYRSALWAHVGDSRIYYLSGGRVRLQTKDHSVPQAMSNAGEIEPSEIRFHEDRNRLLRSLGSRGDLRPTIQTESQALEPGDAFLLASDGFWEYVYETEMEVELAKSSGAEDWLSRMERRLKERAPGDHDNYTAIAVFTSER